MTDSLPTISDIKSISLEEFDRMSGPAARPVSRQATTATSVTATTRSLPTGVPLNTLQVTPDVYSKALLLNFLVKASNGGLINVPTTNTDTRGKPIFAPSYDGVRPSIVYMPSRDHTQSASSITNTGELTTKRSFVRSGRSGYLATEDLYPRGFFSRTSALKRKLQESQEAIRALKKMKRSYEEGVVWSDKDYHPVDLTVTGKVDHSVRQTSSFRSHPVGLDEPSATAVKTPDVHHVTNDVSRTTRDAQSQKVNSSSQQTSPVKKRRSLSEVVNSLTSKQRGQKSSNPK
ncbi:PREDICTED: uncharacterized protein LOC109464472 [Branchiostoma belcheri]|uniref:Uncharacterized protein LOC109464472 n=1 Tax=Branchiostoma belcheri TaxID=7741 RepID=A0A6P4YIZ3_BRABE|nr:PREDICTED: uncharacterized protein LOC109464472 [Branchiostoma belcheri]XP_019617026.1 PREDICTED: uncharacterized protein LOC109464472 [Branchiostoma belcheri]